MKVAWITTYPENPDGIAEYSANIVSELRKMANVLVLAQKENVSGENYIINVWSNHDFDVSIPDELEKINPDIIHLQFLVGLFGKKNIFKLFRLFSALKNKNLIVTIHSDLDNIPFSFLFSYFTFKKARLLLVFNEYQKMLLVRRFSIPEEKVRVIPFGVMLLPESPETYEQKERNIVVPGFVRKTRNVELIINAFSKININYKLVFAGKVETEDYLKKLHDLTKKLGIEKNVIFIDKFLSKNALANWLRKASLVVVKTEGGPSGSVNLAFANSDVCVVERTQFTEELVKKYGCGLLFEKDDLSSLLKAMHRVLNDNKLQKEFFHARQKYIEENRPEHIAKILLAIYKAEYLN